MPYKYRDMKWSDMSAKQQAKAGSKAEHKAAKTAYEAKQEAKATEASPSPSLGSMMLASSRDEPVTGPTFEPTASNDEPARSEAVERTKAYDKSGDYKFSDMKWSDMSNTQKSKAGSKAEHKAAKKDGYFANAQDYPNMGPKNYANPDHYEENLAVEELQGIKDKAFEGTVKGSGERRGWRKDLSTEDFNKVAQLENTIYGKDNIEDYNFAMAGKGSLEGKEMISKSDLKGLRNAGFSDQEIVDHVEKGKTGGAYLGGDKAERLLGRMIAGIKASTEEPTLPPDQSTQPGSGDNSVIQPGNPTGGDDNVIQPDAPIGGDNNVIQPGVPIGGDNNNQIQDVDITQGNQQDLNVNQDNEIDVAITGDGNVSDIEQDNTVVNQGGNQSNNATVTGTTAGTSSSNFLQNYLSRMDAFDTLRDVGIGLSGTSSSADISDSYNQNTNQIQDVDATQDTNQNFNVTQDNDLDAQITGNNNVSQITQDNSVRSYGGSQNNFTYNSGSSANGVPNYLTDSPVSAATMAGYYAPNDSPASNAAFVDRYQTMNADAQKKYNPFGTAEGFIARGKNVGNMDMSVVNQMNLLRPEIAYARSDMANLNTYGDRYSAPLSTYNSALGIYETIDPFDPEGIAESARKQIKKA